MILSSLRLPQISDAVRPDTRQPIVRGQDVTACVLGRRSPGGSHEHIAIGAVNKGESAVDDWAVRDRVEILGEAADFNIPLTLAGVEILFWQVRASRLPVVLEHLIGACEP